ncbi:hypothetical protein FNF29_04660 [Cafeteria roenbergensis]|uniref:Large ribosomal subunit protein uL3m n=1 Tax=Cafeteria roenbergensis TaxID=33653 RepID=A0A5A8CEP4_CAFRO|nr:hypothetical protein FNF29_04660 [Cafeteria roenbergensis]|eukprot:KAA0151452.1 hypothetical protein FNF29_04660 [Cafeteria roenbergensis]
MLARLGRALASAGAAEGSKDRVVKKKIRKARQFRRVLTPTEEVLPPHQAFAESLPESEAPYVAGSSRRVGVLALKCGMVPEWDVWGVRHALTVLKLEDVRVIQVKRDETEGYTALQVGAGLRNPKRVNQPMAGHFARAGQLPTERLAEFRVSEDAILPVGTPITARHFIPGQYVDVTGITAGKGFAGVMKRWGFGGQRATHGVSKTHRQMGSTGNSTSPGKVWKGKKMPGQMGGEQRTAEALQVFKIDVKRNLVYLRGSVPGKTGTVLKMRDCFRVKSNPFPEDMTVPFPTWKPTEEDLKAMKAWESGAALPAMEVERMREAGTLPADYEEQPPYEIVMRPAGTDPMAPEEGGIAVV